MMSPIRYVLLLLLVVGVAEAFWRSSRKDKGHWLSWGSWSKYGPCNSACQGVAKRTRTRRWSVYPWKKWVKTQEVKCHTDTPCPIDGAWSDWKDWSGWGPCSISCMKTHRGFQLRGRQRSCNQPAPAHGGTPCPGYTKNYELRMCSLPQCPPPVDGGWSPWSKWTDFRECTKVCGGGFSNRTRQRACTQPAPAHGGKQCVGYGFFTHWKKCNDNPCSVDGGWSEWSEWMGKGDCSNLCGNGTMNLERLRSCDNPKPAHGGNDCDGEGSQTKTAPCSGGTCAEMCSAGSEPFVAHPDPSKFYQCDHGVAYIHACAPGTLWSQSAFSCVHVKQADKSVRESSSGCPPTGVLVLPYTNDCSKYVHCFMGTSKVMQCPEGTKFDAVVGVCNHASLVECN